VEFHFLASTFSCFSTVITVVVGGREGVLFSLLAFMPDTQERVRVDVSCMGELCQPICSVLGFAERTGQVSLFFRLELGRVAGEFLSAGLQSRLNGLRSILNRIHICLNLYSK
jgi:hypothetical protein